MRRILVVDDAAFMRRLIRATLEGAGFDIAGEAADGARAIELYAELRPDAVTLDLVMPSADGLTALEALMALDPGARVVVVSAIDQRGPLLRAMRLGIADYVVKPWTGAQLVGAMERALRRG